MIRVESSNKPLFKRFVGSQVLLDSRGRPGRYGCPKVAGGPTNYKNLRCHRGAAPQRGLGVLVFYQPDVGNLRNLREQMLFDQFDVTNPKSDAGFVIA